MQIVGRECAACGESIRKLGDGDGCGACDVVLCRACFQGTARCPSCQREIAQTRDREPRAGASLDPMLARGRSLVLAVVLGLVAAWIVVPAFSHVTSVPRLVVHAFLLIVLLYQLLRGRALARWILAGIGVLSAATNSYGALHMPLDAVERPLALLVAGLMASAAFVLVFPRSVARFLELQRVRHP